MFAEGLFEQIMKTIEEKATDYTDSTDTRVFGCEETLDATDLIRQGYIAGATEALAEQWRSVVVELPEEHDEVLVNFSHAYAPNSIEQAVAYYDGEDWYTQDGAHIRPSHWLPIPELPKN